MQAILLHPMQLEILPKKADPVKLTADHEVLHGLIPLSSLKRIEGLLASNEGDVEVNVSLDVEEEKHKSTSTSLVLRCRIVTTLSLVCQRCLQTMSYPVEHNIQFVLVSSEQQGEQLPDKADFVVLQRGELFLWELVEDELIVLVPHVPKHSVEGDCLCLKSLNQAGRKTEDQLEEREKVSAFGTLIKNCFKNQ